MGNSLQPNQILCSIGCCKVVQNGDVKVGVPNLIIFGLHFFLSELLFNVHSVIFIHLS
jgi:hypothetical protein